MEVKHSAESDSRILCKTTDIVHDLALTSSTSQVDSIGLQDSDHFQMGGGGRTGSTTYFVGKVDSIYGGAYSLA